MNPTDLSFLPFLQVKPILPTDGDAAMACLPAYDEAARAYEAAVSEGWAVAQYGRDWPRREA